MKRVSDSETNDNKRSRQLFSQSTTLMNSNDESNDCTQLTDSSISSNPSTSEAPTIPTTLASSMPMFGLFGSNANRSTFPMSYGSNFDSRLFGMTNNDHNMPVNPSVLQFPGTTMPNMNVNSIELNGHSQNSAATDPHGRSSSPLPPFSSDEAKSVSEMMKEKNLASLQRATKRLTGWLKKGLCNKSNNDQFLDMITCAHNQVWRLMSEKTEKKEQIFEERREISKTISNITSGYNEVVRVLETAHVKKVWDHFTRPQRKNLSTWQEEALLLKKWFRDEMDDCEEDEVSSTVSSNDSDSDNSENNDDVELDEEWEKLNNELASIQNNLEIKKKENDNLCEENEKKNLESKKTIAERIENLKKLDSTIAELKKFKVDAILSKTSNENKENLYTKQPFQKSRLPSDKARSTGVQIKIDEARLVTLISVFLYVHPFGASIDYICSYLAQVSPQACDTRYIESVMRKFPEVFKEKCCGVGASLCKNWIFLGFIDNN